ncbi:unnamed protein product [Blepharisma stoltei]|uniref:LYR motif-containing protein Cup1-like N-terminal domain-containing protein n=1 Tax=Blepharisma stoltei TaxID=1481888 RepID=A0AAU9JX14_9CILI|nr:unnamed protein product [Blepharisma stoltei]
MINFELLLRKETRQPLVQTILRQILKESRKQTDEVVRKYLISTTLYCFKLEKKSTELKKIENFLNLQNDLLNAIKKANNNNWESKKYLVDLAYGQICFTPRHDHFIQARYLGKLPFGKKPLLAMPYKEGYQITGPNPVPIEFLNHAKDYIKQNPSQAGIYEDILRFTFN